LFCWALPIASFGGGPTRLRGVEAHRHGLLKDPLPQLGHRIPHGPLAAADHIARRCVDQLIGHLRKLLSFLGNHGHLHLSRPPADDQYMLYALPAANPVDSEHLRLELHANESRLADEPTMSRLFKNRELGAEPPIGRIFGLSTMMDESLKTQGEMTFQAGTHQDAVRMRIEDYVRLAQPRAASFIH